MIFFMLLPCFGLKTLHAQPALTTSTPIHTAAGGHVVLHDMGMVLEAGAELPGTGTWHFAGTAGVVLENNSLDAAFHHVVMDNPGGLTLAGGPMDVEGLFDFVEGVVDATAERVRFGAAAMVLGASGPSHVEGWVEKSGGTDFAFPLGDAGIFQPVEVFELGGSSTTFEARYFAEGHPDPTIPFYNGNTWPVSTCDYWSLERTAGTGVARVRLTWGNNGCNEVNDFNFMRIARYDNGFWDVPIVEGDDPEAGSIATIAQVDVFGDFALASDQGLLNILPITLLHFAAEANGPRTVMARWTTATEVNNDYFTVERSLDLEHWEVVGTLPGAGHSTTAIDYAYPDDDPYHGTSYYRLLQTDYDGTTTVSDAAVVHFGDHSPFGIVHLYHNGAGLHLAYEAMAPRLRAEIIDVQGRVLQAIPFANQGTTAILQPQVARGIYLLRLTDGTHSDVRRFFW